MRETGIYTPVGDDSPSIASPVARWMLRLTLMALLVVSYFTLWQPVRTGWTQSFVYPVLAEIATTSDAHHVVLGGRSVTIVHKSASGEPTQYVISPPAGVKFLLPALFIIAVAPKRPDGLYFFAGHFAFSVLITITFAASIADGAILGAVGRGIQVYVVDAYSLAIPIFSYIRSVRPA